MIGGILQVWEKGGPFIVFIFISFEINVYPAHLP
jgi:hypothetical protein